MTETTTRCIKPVLCRSCKVQLGVNHGDRPRALFCTDPVCPHVTPCGANDERDALLVVLYQAGMNPAQLSVIAGVTPQRVAQILRGGASRVARTPAPAPTI